MAVAQNLFLLSLSHPVEHNLADEETLFVGVQQTVRPAGERAVVHFLAQSFNLLQMMTRRGFTVMNERIDGLRSKTRRRETVDIHGKHQVTEFLVVINFLTCLYVHYIVENLRHGLQIRRFSLLALEDHANDDIRPHLTRHIGREIVHQPPVH